MHLVGGFLGGATLGGTIVIGHLVAWAVLGPRVATAMVLLVVLCTLATDRLPRLRGRLWPHRHQQVPLNWWSDNHPATAARWGWVLGTGFLSHTITDWYFSMVLLLGLEARVVTLVLASMYGVARAFSIVPVIAGCYLSGPTDGEDHPAFRAVVLAVAVARRARWVALAAIVVLVVRAISHL